MGWCPVDYAGEGDSGGVGRCKEKAWRVCGRDNENRNPRVVGGQPLAVPSLSCTPMTSQPLPLFTPTPRTPPSKAPLNLQSWAPLLWWSAEAARAAGCGEWTSGCCSHSPLSMAGGPQASSLCDRSLSYTPVISI